MADETTQTDTTTSPSDPAAADATTTADTTAADAGSESAEGADASDAADKDSTVLGGEADDADKDGKDEPAAGPPEKYELSLEGVTLDTALVSEAEPIFRELGLTNEQANALLPLAPKLMETAQTAMLAQLSEAGAQQKKDWLDAFIADKDIGGAKREESEHLAAKGLDALGFSAGHPFRKALTETGFGNHPDMIRAFRAIGEMVGEDGSFVRSDATAPKNTPTEQRWYGKQGAE